jgi:hypothetical protein
MLTFGVMRQDSIEPDSSAWSEWDRLFNEFTEAIAEVIALQTRPIQAATSQEQAVAAFDFVLHRAEERKRRTKRALLSHVEIWMPVPSERPYD